MLALMVDPHYKSLQIVENYVGHGNAIYLVIWVWFERSHSTFGDSFWKIKHFYPSLGVYSVEWLPIEEDKTNMFVVNGASMENLS
jgi:hypothetical protein